MTLDDLDADVHGTYGDLPEEFHLDLDRETQHELAMLATAFRTDDVGELVRRGVHELFRRTVDTGDLDFHLRTAYDVTYDEYLSGMTYDEMAGGNATPEPEDDRRYRR